MINLRKSTYSVLLFTAVPLLSAPNYQELFHTLGKKRGTINKAILEQQPLTTKTRIKPFTSDLCILDVLSLKDCPQDLTQLENILRRAYFKGLQNSFVLRTQPTGKNAQLRKFLIRLNNTTISAGIKAKDADSLFEEIDKEMPALSQLANKLSQEEQVILDTIHSDTDTPADVDLCSFCDTTSFNLGLDLGKKINRILLEELNGTTVSTKEKEAFIRELFDFLITHSSPGNTDSPKDSEVAQFCAGIYLSHAELGTIVLNSTDAANNVYDDYKTLRDTIANIIGNTLGDFIFEYNGYYRELELLDFNEARISEGFRDKSQTK